MADANLKPRPAHAEPQTSFSVPLEQRRATGSSAEQRRRLAFPWMTITDGLFQKTCSKLSIGFIRTSLTRLAPPN
jgi:hypothetical protein